ncbi:hypothetical protein E3N88_26813 [Mikania micrantha]|uniref:Uncharacterized protein n=1 Tax=Mikania micrantha TaxID=192012 RepID=A0A5N6MXW1_9ASTR|nr:hypothetical protein E3N88_26813 [Mikania micrantha]
MDFHSFYPARTTRCSLQNLQFYTAPSSPTLLDVGYNDHEFEFAVTTQTFMNRCHFQQTYPSFWCTKTNDNEEKYRLPARAKSFCSGQVLPLKPSPRLQSTLCPSPKSPSSLLKLRFCRPCAWNDDFDPFQYALEKVSDETRARMSFHRRSQSHSMYRTNSVTHWLDGVVDQDKDQKNQGFNSNNNTRFTNFNQGYGHGGLSMMSNEQLKLGGPTPANMMEHKESINSRRDVPSEHVAKPRAKSSQMVRTTTEGRWLGRRAKDADHEHMKGQSESRFSTESKIRRVASLLFKLKKSSNESNRRMKLCRCFGYAPAAQQL